MVGNFEARGGRYKDFTLPTSCVVSRIGLFYNSASSYNGRFNDTQSQTPSHEYTAGIWYKVDAAGILRPPGDEPNGATVIGPLGVKTTKSKDCQETGKAPIVIGDHYGKTKVVSTDNIKIGNELTVNKLGYLSNSVNTGDLVVARAENDCNNSAGTAGASTVNLEYNTYQCGYIKD